MGLIAPLTQPVGIERHDGWELVTAREIVYVVDSRTRRPAAGCFSSAMPAPGLYGTMETGEGRVHLPLSSGYVRARRRPDLPDLRPGAWTCFPRGSRMAVCTFSSRITANSWQRRKQWIDPRCCRPHYPRRLLIRPPAAHRFDAGLTNAPALTPSCESLSMNLSPAGRAGPTCFGSGLLFLFLTQVLTGIGLALYYVPAANDAHVTVAYIVKVVSQSGSFRRQPAFLRCQRNDRGVAAAHDPDVFLWRVQGPPRARVDRRLRLVRINSGDGFYRLSAAVGSESLLRLAVGTNVMGEMPGAGNVVKQLLRGGNQMGTITLTRFLCSTSSFCPRPSLCR